MSWSQLFVYRYLMLDHLCVRYHPKGERQMNESRAGRIRGPPGQAPLLFLGVVTEPVHFWISDLIA